MKGWLGFLLKAGLSVGILAVIAAKTDLSRISSILRSISAEAIIVGLALMVLQSIVTAYRWVLVMAGVGVSVGLRPAVQALYASLFINQCVPSYVGGDAYRVFWLYREGNPLAIATRGVLIDRVSALIALVGMIVMTLPALFARFSDHTVEMAMVTVAVAGVCGSVVFFAFDALPRRWLRFRVAKELAALSTAARRILLTRASGWAVNPLAILVHALGAGIMFVFARDLGLPITALDCLLLIAPIMLLSAVPISISGWGVREGVMVGALGMVGIAPEQALALSVLLGFALLANGLLGVLPLAFGGERFVATRVPPLEASHLANRAR